MPPIFRIPPDATNSVCSVSGALLSAMMHKCKRSTSRYSCKVTLNSVPWIESFVKAAISLQITAEGKTVDKKTAFGLGLDYIQSFTFELALLPNGPLLSTYLFFPTRNGQSKFDQKQIWNKLLPTGVSPGAIFLHVIVQIPIFILQCRMFQFIQLLLPLNFVH